MNEMPWYNRGLFSSLNLRQKTLLTIGLTGLILLVIFISGWMIDANLPTDFTIKMQAPSFSKYCYRYWSVSHFQYNRYNIGICCKCQQMV